MSLILNMTTNFVQIEFQLLTASHLGNLCMRLAFNFMPSSRTYSIETVLSNSQKLRSELSCDTLKFMKV